MPAIADVLALANGWAWMLVWQSVACGNLWLGRQEKTALDGDGCVLRRYYCKMDQVAGRQGKCISATAAT